MATPRLRTRTRNKDLTIRQLIDSIGEILRAEGFNGLRVNRIARHTGKDKSLIARYFTDLAGLLRAYIKEKDYWIPIFERFVLTEVDGVSEIKETFVTLMQENFDFFSTNSEMQNIILWQISEENDLMTDISNAREEHGERLFRLTDPTFEGSDVNFRAVIGLLLGGIYYMVLHAETNKSKVCGIDLNIESDKLEILKTIEQVITWACEKADPKEELNQARYMMNYQFELLETFAAQLSARTDVAETNAPDAMMINETKKLSRNIPNHVTSLSNDTQINSYMKMCMTKLTEVSEILFVPERKYNPDAELVVDLMMSLFKMFGEGVPDGIFLPKLFCRREFNGTLYDKWQLIKMKLEKSKIDPFIIDIVYLPFENFCNPKHDIRWCDYKYLKTYATHLEAELSNHSVTDPVVLELLIGVGMNHSRFVFHYTKLIAQSCERMTELNRSKVLLKAQTTVGQACSRTNLSFDPSRNSIVEELNRWIDMELKRSLNLPDDFEEENPLSLVTNLNAGQLAYWQKLQYDHGIYDETTLDLFSEKISHNFKLRGGVRPSVSSVKSKFYAKIEVNYKPLEEKLEKMLNEVRLYGN